MPSAQTFWGRLHIDRLRVHHLGLVGRFLKVADGAMYTLALFIGAAMTRSYSGRSFLQDERGGATRERGRMLALPGVITSTVTGGTEP